MQTLNLNKDEMELLRFIVGDFIEYEYTEGCQQEKACKKAERIQKKILKECGV